MRFPRLLKTSTLEPPKRNRARFPFDSLHGWAKFRLSSVVFRAKFIFAKKSVGKAKHCTISRGVSKGGRGPLLSLRVRVHRERGSRNTLSLCASLVTFSASRKSPSGATGSWSPQKATKRRRHSPARHIQAERHVRSAVCLLPTITVYRNCQSYFIVN